MSEPSGQWLICYHKAGAECVYATAYTTEDMQRQTKNCVERYGTFVGAKAVAGSERVPNDGGPKVEPA